MARRTYCAQRSEGWTEYPLVPASFFLNCPLGPVVAGTCERTSQRIGLLTAVTHRVHVRFEPRHFFGLGTSGFQGLELDVGWTSLHTPL